KPLIDQLGSERFKDREQAAQELAKLGNSALPALKEAAKSRDPEVRRRAQQPRATSDRLICRALVRVCRLSCEAGPQEP
ncbi:MAG TPA: HEAT repeat domain-containing protein, partial [Gemmataceae bacterium]|nr:HEAT repeat domain-containing protein [Gemmataceae bacterium]